MARYKLAYEGCLCRCIVIDTACPKLPHYPGAVLVSTKWPGFRQRNGYFFRSLQCHTNLDIRLRVVSYPVKASIMYSTYYAYTVR